MKTTLKTLAIAALASLAMLSTGCSKANRQKSVQPDARLESVVWRLVKFDGETVDKAGKYEISFMTNGRIAGIGECNRFFGPYERTNNSGGIKMGPAGATMMACLGANIEGKFFAMFENATQYQFDGESLYIFVKDEMKPKAVFISTGKPVETPAE